MKLVFKTLVIFLIFTNYAHAQSWNLVWSDSFTNATINNANWTFENGNNNGWGNNELEYYTNRIENATVKNGNLLIIARKENYMGSEYTSARMITKNKQQWQYGKIEARIKLPQSQGIWPAFWTLGSNIDNVSWPECGEIDIMEHVNFDPKINGTMHWNNGGHAYWGGTTNCNVSNYHIYSIEWNVDSIVWKLDNVTYHSGNIKNNINNTNAFHKPFFMILNIAVGGNWPGSPNASSVFPDTMFVDYINVFQKAPLKSNTINLLNNVVAFPNPVTDVLHITSKEIDNKKLKLKVFNSLGVEIHNAMLDNTANAFTISTSQWNKGLYFFTLQNEIDIMYKGNFIKE
jgi:beta-glucanase (GH16 family)